MREGGPEPRLIRGVVLLCNMTVAGGTRDDPKRSVSLKRDFLDTLKEHACAFCGDRTIAPCTSACGNARDADPGLSPADSWHRPIFNAVKLFFVANFDHIIQGVTSYETSYAPSNQ